MLLGEVVTPKSDIFNFDLPVDPSAIVISPAAVIFMAPSFVFPSLNSIVCPEVIIWSKLPVPNAPALISPDELIFPEAVTWPSPITTSEPTVLILPKKVWVCLSPSVPKVTAPLALILPEAVMWPPATLIPLAKYISDTSLLCWIRSTIALDPYK